MLRVMLEGLLDRYKKEGRRKITLEEIHKATGIHRKILSRLKNHPADNTYTEHIEKILVFFYYRFKEIPYQSLKGRDLMRSLVSDLIDVVPEQGTFPEAMQAASRYFGISDVRGPYLSSDKIWEAAEKLEISSKKR